ncbi:MAG: hypothetical protein QM579_13865 [Desulfovibrio sp.]|uniref:hypothetical protein n=1 Tax=Desulfovibrio sp. TaxID=885 RepID=UPI0039E62F2D
MERVIFKESGNHVQGKVTDEAMTALKEIPGKAHASDHFTPIPQGSATQGREFFAARHSLQLPRRIELLRDGRPPIDLCFIFSDLSL